MISENPPAAGVLTRAPATGSVLEKSQINTVFRWIQQGAPNN
jgi:hypothetical protein